LVGGCASKPVVSDAETATVFKHPIERVQKAAIESIVMKGFDVTIQEPTYVEGFRPHKLSLFPGSGGGETVGIWLDAQGPNRTEVRVDTAKTLFGWLGQKNWDFDILYEMLKSLPK